MAKDKKSSKTASRETPDRWRDEVWSTSANTAVGRAPARETSADNKNTRVEKVSLPEKGKRTRKQKKLAKKSAKFDEMDLRNYPMTVGSWIGTFILLAIPLIGGICAICWFFGVGNKSRSAWVRSYVVIALLIVLILGILLGVGWTILSKSAKAEGASSFGEVMFYGADKVITALEGVIGEDAAEQARAMVAQIFNVQYTPSTGGGESGEGGGSGAIQGGEFAEA